MSTERAARQQGENASKPRLWNEGRIALEAAALLRSPTWRGTGCEQGDDQPVLLIPGFLAGDDSLGLLTRWLRRTGHRTRRAGIRANVGCSNTAVQRLVERAEEMAQERGTRIALIGQSRGGLLARVVAVRRPDLVSGIVTLGSPHTDPFAVNPFMRAQIVAVGLLGTLGVPGFFKASCLWGTCCTTFAHDTSAAFPAEVGFVSLYSRHDGIVSWQACLDPAAEHVEVATSHCGMAADGRAFETVGRALCAFRRADTQGAALPLAA